MKQPSRSRFGPLPLITGDDLIALGYRPGPDFRRMLNLVEDAQLEGDDPHTGRSVGADRGTFPRP